MKKYIYSILTVFILFGCEDFLEEEVYTEFDPDVFLQDQSGLDALVTGAYGQFQLTWGTDFSAREHYYILGEMSTDILWETGGGLNALVLPILNFNWAPADPSFAKMFDKYYQAIAAANNVLRTTDSVEGVDEAALNQARAEARFIRACAYYFLHTLFGPTPIIEILEGASLDEIEAIGKETPRATEEEYRSYVEADFMFAIDNLEYGGVSSRANKGSAFAMLAKFYLNNKQWTEAAAAAQEVINNGGYSLYNDYTTLFAVEGEGNEEFIFRFECLPGATSPQQNVYIPHVFPPNFPIQSNWANFGAQFRTYTSFYETFEDTDQRAELLITEYTPTNTGVLTQLSRDANGNALDNVRSFKFVPDPNATGRFNGNDQPLVRLSDMLLTRAEALNEIDGLNQESIDLINLVRARVSVSEVAIGNFTSQDDLRDFILAERGREFYSEGLRREDLIRHGSYIQQALDRGLSATPNQVLFPIPQAQIDNNPNLEQNQGY